MKPIFEKIPRLQHQALHIKLVEAPPLDMPYHYHPEYELALTERRKGKRFIGSNVSEMQAYDLVFLGSNLPHCFMGDGPIDPTSKLIVVQFDLDMFGENFWALPESIGVKELLQKSQQGMEIKGQTYREIRDLMFEMVSSSPLRRLVQLFDILERLSQTNEYQLLSPRGFTKQYHNQDYHRLNAVYNFIVQNFKGDIRLGEAAQVANLSETAFCRFFKQRTLKTFKQVVNEMRVSYACDLILKGRLSTMTVSEVAVAAGFQNLSNFNRQFKKITHYTPATYAQAFKNSEAPPLQFTHSAYPYTGSGESA